jgi:hypothetical protein
MISISKNQDVQSGVFDPLGSLSAYSGNEEAIFVVRPDRFIADIISPDENKSMLSWVEPSYSIRSTREVASAA